MSNLLHDYDAAKRREYYLRTRKLVGRSKQSPSPAVDKTPAATMMPEKKTHAQRRKELESRVARLQERLKQLQLVLKALVEAAQQRSGVDDNSAEEAKSETSNPSNPATEKKTQQEKDEAAKAAQEYRDKNKDLQAQVIDLNNKIKAIHEQIKRLRRDELKSRSNQAPTPRSKPIEFVKRTSTDRLRRSGNVTTQ